MITKNRELAELLSEKDCKIIAELCKKNSSHHDWFWQNDTPKAKELTVWNLKQKRFISQILASLAETATFITKKAEPKRTAEGLDLPLEFVKNIQKYK